MQRNEHPLQDGLSELGPAGYGEAGDDPCLRRHQAIQGSGRVLPYLAPHSCNPGGESAINRRPPTGPIVIHNVMVDANLCFSVWLGTRQ